MLVKIHVGKPSARLAESDSGGAVSPKIIAAAVIAGSSSMLSAMPIRPIPIVPTTVHELPMEAETTVQISAVGRNGLD